MSSWLNASNANGSPECLAGREGMGELIRSTDEARLRLLVADDNADMRQFLVQLLSELYNVETAPDGQAALAAARARRPDLVLSDVRMPKLDGIGLVREFAQTRNCKQCRSSCSPSMRTRNRGWKDCRRGPTIILSSPSAPANCWRRVAAHLEMARLRKELAERVRQSEYKYRSLFENSLDAIFLTVPNGQIVAANAAACRHVRNDGRRTLSRRTRDLDWSERSSLSWRSSMNGHEPGNSRAN